MRMGFILFGASFMSILLFIALELSKQTWRIDDKLQSCD
jgi:hypothetical protein